MPGQTETAGKPFGSECKYEWGVLMWGLGIQFANSSVMFKKPKSRLPPRGREKLPEDILQTTFEKGEGVEESPIILAFRLKHLHNAKLKFTLSFGGDEGVRVVTSCTIGFTFTTQDEMGKFFKRRNQIEILEKKTVPES
ncbi:hypothetical protein BDR07DRAFT_1581663 [Suillus spraguei]|nr:hypothetical protein BDR07DRAFT_1581663 [Suillus spraguei]